jgi:hypothetical protein
LLVELPIGQMLRTHGEADIAGPPELDKILYGVDSVS